MKLLKLTPGIYTGKIKTYNTRTSNKTGLTYLNLTVTINANGQIFKNHTVWIRERTWIS